MYFPYLYARQAELLALRDVASLAHRITPVLEPAVIKTSDIAKALEAWGAAKSGAIYVVENPSAGAFAGSSRIAATWRAALTTQLAEPWVRPTFLVGSTTSASDVVSFIASHPGRSTGIVLRSNSVSPPALLAALGPDTTVFAHRTSNPHSYIRALTPARAIEIADSFIPAARNADYGPEEWFSSGNVDFKVQGAFGFSDFTVLSSALRVSGGGPIGAMAVHLSYIDPTDNSIWIEHFISDETRTTHGDLHSKFMESLEKLEARIRLSPSRFIATGGLSSYRSQYATGKTTGLPSNKRQEIAHHLETVATAY